MKLCFLAGVWCFSVASSLALAAQAAQPLVLKKERDVVVYSNEVFYCAFPSIVKRPDGELLVAFRRAPNRRLLGERGNSHADPNSYLVAVRSTDGGQTWSQAPDFIYAHPLGGSQDPCLLQLRDGSLLCTSYAWAQLTPAAAKLFTNSTLAGNFAFLGGFVLRSSDSRTWSDPLIPPTVPGETQVGPYGKPIPAYNRGAVCEGKDGRLFWVVAAATSGANGTGTHLLISADKGASWKYSCPVAVDEKVTFNEASVYETSSGQLVAFIRTAGLDDHTVVARSRDGGRTFARWEDAKFQGHPHQAIRLRDNRVLLVYGYRHKPFGIRARVLDPECERFDTEELVVREDGGSGDLGYPWAVQVSDNRVLMVYYMNIADGDRHIAGTFLSY